MPTAPDQAIPLSIAGGLGVLTHPRPAAAAVLPIRTTEHDAIQKEDGLNIELIISIDHMRESSILFSKEIRHQIRIWKEIMRDSVYFNDAQTC